MEICNGHICSSFNFLMDPHTMHIGCASELVSAMVRFQYELAIMPHRSKAEPFHARIKGTRVGSSEVASRRILGDFEFRAETGGQRVAAPFVGIAVVVHKLNSNIPISYNRHRR